jgi:hypothetical protein
MPVKHVYRVTFDDGRPVKVRAENELAARVLALAVKAHLLGLTPPQNLETFADHMRVLPRVVDSERLD